MQEFEQDSLGLLQALNEGGVPEDLPFTFDLRTFRNMLNIILATDAGSLDLLGMPPARGRSRCFGSEPWSWSSRRFPCGSRL